MLTFRKFGSMNRIDRISAILIQLQSKRIVKARDIGDRFNISLRTVYRDIKSLEEAGVPVIGEGGVGYSLMDGYRLPPVMFTREEAIAFLTAEKLVEKLTDAENGANYKSAMYKVKAVLRGPEKDFLANIDGNIAVMQTRSRRHSQPDLNILQTILKGIAERKVISIHYLARYKEEKTERNIEPIGVFFLDNYWHLVSYCQMRHDYRDFRLDRISDLALTNEIFERKHPSLDEHMQKMYKHMNLHHVEIEVDKNAAKYITEERYFHGFTSQHEVDDKVIMTFLTGSMEGFARWFMMFGDHARIRQPAILKEKIKAIVTRISKNLED